MTSAASPPARRLRSTSVRAWLRLVRVYHQISRRLSDDLRARQLSLAQFDVLAQVGAAEGLSQQQLAARLLVTKGNVCQLLDRTDAAGLTERRRDRRANRVYLTPHGRALFAAVVPAHEALIVDLLQPLAPDQQRTLHALLRQLERALRD